MNFLVTGGCGFIGINLIRHLVQGEERNRIRVLDNLSVGKVEDLASVGKVAEITKEEIAGAPTKRLELVVGDVRDEKVTSFASRGANQ